MPPGLFAAQQIAPILTPEIISRLRVIFRFYKTLHFQVDPVSGPVMPAGVASPIRADWKLKIGRAGGADSDRAHITC
jgi:hypothetical protein